MPRPEGDPAAAEQLGDVTGAAASRFEELSQQGRAGSTIAGWTGEAAVAFTGVAGAFAEEQGRMGERATVVSRAFTAFGQTLTDLQRDHQTLEATKASLDARRRDLLADIESTRDATDAEISALQDRARLLGDDYADLVEDHDVLQRRVRDNEDQLRGVLERSTSLESIESLPAAPPIAVAAMSKPGAPWLNVFGSSRMTADWWASLTDAEREAVILAYPRLIGSADGVPADARDQANRLLLEGDLDILSAKQEDGVITGDEELVLRNAHRTQEGLAHAADYRDPLGRQPGGQLWLYDPAAFDGDGRIGIVVGDLDTAEDVAVRVPGITNDADDIPKLTSEAIALHESATYHGSDSVASLIWLGYDTPESFADKATLTEGRAEDGGARLADDISGILASRGDDPHLTVIGHSYGSTTVAHAASAGSGIDADEVVLVGSPGAGGGNDHASDLTVGNPDADVWVGRNSRDAVTYLGDEGTVDLGTLFGAGLGRNPAEDTFGATRFEAEDPGKGYYVGIDQHGHYFDPDTESLANMGRIVVGDDGSVTEAPHVHDPWLGEAEDPEYDREARPSDETRTRAGG